MDPKKQDPNTEEEEDDLEGKEGEEGEEEDQDDLETEDEDSEEEVSPEELKSRLKRTKKALNAANSESKARRLRLEALEKEKKDREDAELSEVERVKKESSEKEIELEKLRSENRSLKLSQEFASAAQTLRLSFVSEQSRKTALTLLDPEEVGEDFEGMEDELKRLAKDHSYLFGKPDPNQFIDDGRKKSKVNASTVTRKTVENKRRRISPL